MSKNRKWDLYLRISKLYINNLNYLTTPKNERVTEFVFCDSFFIVQVLYKTIQIIDK